MSQGYLFNKFNNVPCYRGVIFKHAISSMAVLFFDEADAFFGRSTHAKGAYVRYADSEANFLLMFVKW
jgi:hypothetical protein